tara:strand:+ start:1709 stop:2479 length:771 start_codon:yes stop_codon:yes gene_type:complete
MNYIAITNNISDAHVVSASSVDQIMVDIETLGKKERQKEKNAIISNHILADVAKLNQENLHSDIICRINPYHHNTTYEIDSLIEYKPKAIMIPMINDVQNLDKIIRLVKGNFSIIPLIETPYSLLNVERILEREYIKQMHFGLNDLGIALGYSNLFKILNDHSFGKLFQIASSSYLEICGFGGIGNPLYKNSVDPLYILDEHKRLGSNSVILSRAFFNKNYNAQNISKALQIFEERWQSDYYLHSKSQLTSQINLM